MATYWIILQGYSELIAEACYLQLVMYMQSCGTACSGLRLERRVKRDRSILRIADVWSGRVILFVQVRRVFKIDLERVL